MSDTLHQSQGSEARNARSDSPPPTISRQEMPATGPKLAKHLCSYNTAAPLSPDPGKSDALKPRSLQSGISPDEQVSLPICCLE